MKRILLIIIVLIMLLSSTQVFADMSFSAYYPDMNYDFTVTLDGQYWLGEEEYGMPIYPFFIEGSLYLPVDVMSSIMNVTMELDYEYNSLYLYSNNPYIPENDLGGHDDYYYTDEEFQKDLDAYLIEFEEGLHARLTDEEFTNQLDSQLRDIFEAAGLIEKKAPNFTNTTDEEDAAITEGGIIALQYFIESVKVVWLQYKPQIIILFILYITWKVYNWYTDFKKDAADSKYHEENELKIINYEKEIENLKKILGVDGIKENESTDGDLNEDKLEG